MNLVIKNIGWLVQYRENPIVTISGSDMKIIPLLKDAWLFCKDGNFRAWGPMSKFNGELKVLDPSGTAKIIDAAGGMVLPSWCDSHTHIVFAAPREQEFVDRIHGLTYEEIASKGGGILNSAARLAETPEEQLFEDAAGRIREMIAFGTGAIEIKSGYGLSFDAELKMLRVIKKLKSSFQLPIKATFLGAHALPLAYKQNRAAYIQLLTDEMLPAIAEQGLADYCDVFCDRGFFTPAETETILEAGWKFGLQPKIHANELDFSGGIQVGVKHRALSVDHLEFTGDEEIALLKESGTMPTLLPSTAFFLRLHYAPARKMIDAGLPIALATDFNPGSSPSGNMPFVIALSCIYMGMDPSEAINAATINSAYAMGVEKTNGTITAGRKASFFITKPVASISSIPYNFGSNLIHRVFLNGQEF
ncbi:MAG: imidazolonepropionase [Bacteroidetes bacterium]|nr:imidazolonepropionase [Bacteroidota bacterium]